MRTRLLATIAASILVLSACGSDDAPSAGSSPAVSPSSSDATVVTTTPTTGSASTSPGATAAPGTDASAAVPAVLQFTAPLVGGGTFDGASVAGTPTVFWFWAPG